MKKSILNQKYMIIQTLGSGGTSTVYQCKDIHTQKDYAVKITRHIPESGNLEQEWYILKCLSHRGIPKAKEFFIEDNNLHLVEEYIKGITLQQLIEKQKILEEDKIYHIILQLCDIISYLHSFDPPIIYRDLKPSNIMITGEYTVKLLDFGISRLYKEDKTTDTVFMGSKGYAAPEQYGLTQSQRETDIYGIGAVLFFIVTGHAPKNIMEPLEDGSYNANVFKTFIKIIKKSMQIDIKKRYPSVEELKKEILLYLNPSTVEKNDSTMILNSDDTTRIIIEPSLDSVDTSPKRRIIGNKRFWLLIGVSLFTTSIIISIFNYFIIQPNKTGSIERVSIPISSSTPQPLATPKTSGNPVPREQVEKKETVIEGILIKAKPSEIVELDKDDNDNSKGKNKKKENHKEKVSLYYLSTPAEVIKNENFKIKLHSLAVREDYIVAYCDIENGITKSLYLNYKDIYFSLKNGNKVPAITTSSTKLISIKNISKTDNISIYFKKFDLESGKLELRTSINFDDINYNNEINLIINVK